MSTSPVQPDPLAMTARPFAAARKAAMGGDLREHLAFYKACFQSPRHIDGHPDAHADGHPVAGVLANPPVLGDVRTSDSPEGTVTKFLLRIPRSPDPQSPDTRPLSPALDARLAPLDSLETESVIIPMIGRSQKRTHTLCVSSQIGCAMGCGFCETAQMGLIRNLTVREIVAQWYAASRMLGHDISNIVFMGMGEPLDNTSAVLRAIEVLTDHRGPAIPMSRITVSTVGRIDGLDMLGARQREHGWKGLRVAISLNAPNEDVRSELMPINRGMPMADLRDCLIRHPHLGGKKLCIEYVLIPGVNDQPGHAHELAAFLEPINAADPGPSPRLMVNVIPYNPRRDSPWPAPTEERVAEFIAELSGLGLFVKRRRTKGRDTMAACGQLGNEQIRGRKLVGVTIGGA